MCGSPMVTERCGLRACCTKEDGARPEIISRHIPRGKRTLVPSTSAPPSENIAKASGKSTTSTPTCSSRVSALCSIISIPSAERTWF